MRIQYIEYLSRRAEMEPKKFLERRQSSWSAQATGGMIGALVFVLILCLALLSFIFLRRLRISYDNPRFVPTQYLKRKWREWLPAPVKKRYRNSLQDGRSIQERRSPSPSTTPSQMHHLGTSNHDGGNHSEAPDRHASIRSIMTLPAYSATARDTEQIIGREGEREGMDTVVEFPETQDDEEARREEEMESLYQIRVRRREERAAREERRRLRREARARNDREALEALRRESRRARSPPRGGPQEEMSATQLLEDHRNRDRGRRFASVDYAELGVARHDGSRVRANSNESDRPLLSSAASMASHHNRGQPQSPGLPNNSTVSLATTGPGHAHNQSTSSLSRFTTNAADVSDYDDDDASDIDRAPTPYGDGRPSTSRGRRSTSASGRPGMNGNAWGNGSSVDLGNYSMDRLPAEEPPRYEESVRGYSTEQSSRPEIEQPDDQDGQAGQSSYSRGRRFGLPRGWGGRKQTRDEETGNANNEARRVSRQDVPLDSSQGNAPPYQSRPTSEAPELPALMQLPTIEITPFTPVERSSEPAAQQ